MKAVYFDGKSSKPYAVQIQQILGGLQINSIDKEDGINRFWVVDNIKTESFSTSNKVLLSYGDWPQERLQITGKGADEYMIDALETESIIKKGYFKLTRTNPLKLVVGSIFIIASVLYLYIAHLSPYIGEKAVNLIPKEYETKIGQAMYSNMAAMLTIDSTKSKKLLDFYTACGFESDYEIKIDYAAEKTVNAFAVPGGQIVVFEGLIEKTENWDELAALLGHELAHVNQRHSFKQLTRSASSYLLISVLTGDVAGASTVVIDYANQVNELANSRSHEKEADVVGLDYLKTNSIRPGAMADLFTRFMSKNEDLESYGKKLEILSTHPASGNRIEYINELIATDPAFSYPIAENKEAQAIWQELKDMIDIKSKEENKDSFDDQSSKSLDSTSTN